MNKKFQAKRYFPLALLACLPAVTVMMTEKQALEKEQAPRAEDTKRSIELPASITQDRERSEIVVQSPNKEVPAIPDPNHTSLEILDSNNLSSLILTLSSLNQFHSTFWAESIDEFIKQVEQSEFIATELLKALSRFEIISPNENELLVVVLASIESQTLEGHILDILENEDINDQPELLLILEARGVTTSRGRNLIVNALPRIRNDGHLVSAIASLNPTTVTPGELSTINKHFQNLYRVESSKVRSAAIKSIIEWNGHNNIPLINEAMFDPSIDVRQSALFAIGGSGITDPLVKNSLFQILVNERENLGLRIQAFQALKNFSLLPAEYEKYYQFEYRLMGNDTGNPSG